MRTVRTSLDVIPNNKCGVRINQDKGLTHVIIIDRIRYYYSQNKFVCHLEQKKVSEQMRTLLEQNSIIVETILYVISNKNRCIIRTNQNKGRNKLLL
jgi:hypothetical protein